ncbi:cytochrome b N-terminal domain-containing protein [Lysobacter sp. MMG2]|uniref:cytochrome b n=1 Tax=Lysobacter sp. MMG2 TaxID=2801338 RepID=UPI0020B32B43|nr:cytochrome b N-terminal domain-containing protein [Lysobacter sp. MMG2]
MAWVEDRLPWLSFVSAHTATYYAPKNFNIWYLFGALASVVLVNQLVTGIFLAMHFKPSAAEAFSSVEYIMRDVEWGWLIRYMHSTGASLFFVVIYLHMFRALLYGSFKKPRELVWILGMLIYLVLMAEAFLGYVLPWGQMSFWGAKVIISLFGAIPVIGNGLTEWIMGDYLPGDATLNRFFSLHVIALPLILLLLVTVHILALHEMGSNNPDGVEIFDNLGPDGHPVDGIPFHPYYSVEDLLSTVAFLLLAAFIIFFAPTVGGIFLEHDNFTEANSLVTPEHIKPVWYFTPFYAMLRVIPHKLSGVVVMFSALAVLFLLPWLDRGKVKSIRYRGLGYRIALGAFATAFVVLGFIGAGAVTTMIERVADAGADINAIENWIGRAMVAVYFGFFAFVWIYTTFGLERTRPVPERLTHHP